MVEIGHHSFLLLHKNNVCTHLLASIPDENQSLLLNGGVGKYRFYNFQTQFRNLLKVSQAPIWEPLKGIKNPHHTGVPMVPVLRNFSDFSRYAQF